jgi:hypothetical protein
MYNDACAVPITACITIPHSKYDVNLMWPPSAISAECAPSNGRGGESSGRCWQ